MSRSRLIAAVSLLLTSLSTVASADSSFESPKLSPGVVTQGTGFQSSKVSPGVVLQNGGLQSPKLSSGVVVDNTAFQSSKLSLGIVVEVRPGGGIVTPAPLTHW
jgi:hypothetical protein